MLRCPPQPFSQPHTFLCSEGGGGGGGVKLDVVVYNSVMSMCADAGEWRRVLSLLKQMTEEDGIKPDRISFDCLMKACGNGGDWEQALVRGGRAKGGGGVSHCRAFPRAGPCLYGTLTSHPKIQSRDGTRHPPKGGSAERDA